MMALVRLFAALGLLLVLPPARADEIPIRGRVVDEEGDALAGAAVELLPVLRWYESGLADDDPPPAAGTRSGADGSFVVRAPSVGPWDVLLTAGGALPLHHQLMVVEAVDLPTARMPEAASCEVRVAGDEGRPLADVRVEAYPFPFSEQWLGRYWQPASLRGRTGRDGRLFLPCAADDEIEIQAWSYGLIGAVTSIGHGVTAASLTLTAGVPRRLEVRDDAGNPIASAFVRSGTRSWPVGLTGEDGRIELRVPSDGESRTVVVTADDRSGEGQVAAPPRDDPEPARISVTALPTASGQVREADGGRPMEDVVVWVRPGHAARTDAAGRFAVPFVPPRRSSWVSLQAVTPGYFEATTRLAMDGETAVELELEPVSVLAGIVVDPAGEPVPGVDVERASQFARSGADGRFRLPARPNSVEKLTAWKPGYVTARLEAAMTPRTAPGSPAPEIRIVLEHGRTGFGQVVDVDGRPVAGAAVSLKVPDLSQSRRDDPVERRYQTRERRAVTDADGRFELSRLEPETADLWARAPGHATATVYGVDLGRGEGPVDFGTVVLEPGVRVEVRTVDADGRPLPGIDVQVLPWDPSTRRSGSSSDPRYPELTTDADGRFVLEDRAPGEKLSFEARPRGYARAEVVGIEVPPDEPVILVLKPVAGVRGQVVDTAGLPVPEAEVMVWSLSSRGSASGRSTPCDRAGSFEALEVQPGPLRLVAEAAGFAPSEQELTVAPGEVVEGLRFVLGPGAAIEGRVTAATGPVARAQIWVRPSKFPSRIRRPIFSDEDGRFRVDALEPGLVDVTVRARGFVTWDRQIEAPAGTRAVTIELEAGTTVSGLVVGEDLEPVGGAAVRLTQREGFSSGGGARTGADGTFTIENVVDGRYGIEASKEGYAPTEHDGDVHVAGLPVDGVRIRLKRGGAITGHILGLEPERWPEVRLQVHEGNGRPWRKAQVDAEGRYRVDHLRPGEWTVSARDPASGRSAQGRTTLAPGVGEVVLDLEFLPGATLTGLVRLDGEPLPLARVAAQGLDVASEASALTDASGAFSLRGLPDGRYRIQVTGPFPGRLEHRREIEVDGDREIEIELSSHRIRGVVVDADDGAPLAGAGVVLTLGEDASPRREVDVGTAADGSFLLEQVTEGRYRLRAELEGYAPAEREIEIGPGVAVEELVVALEAAAGLELAVRLSRPHERNVFVAVLGDGNRLVDWEAYRLPDSVETPESRARLDRMPAGRWTLVIGAPGHGTVRREVAVPGGLVPVTLPPGSSLGIRVPGLEGEGVPATVTLTGADGHPFIGLAGWSAPAREWPVHDGRATIDGLPPGTWNVTVTLPDGGTLKGEASTSAEGGEVGIVLE